MSNGEEILDERRCGNTYEALLEAQSLVTAYRNGVDVRDSLAFPQRYFQFALTQFPGEEYIVENAATFRKMVREHFYKLLKDGYAKDIKRPGPQKAKAAASPAPEAEIGSLQIEEQDDFPESETQGEIDAIFWGD